MTPIEKLAEKVGFHTSYTNSFGEQIYANDESREALLKAMGYQIDTPQQIELCIQQLEQEPWKSLLQPTQIIRSEEPEYSVTITINSLFRNKNVNWKIITEEGEVLSGSTPIKTLSMLNQKSIDNINYCRFHLPIPSLKEGYHKLDARVSDTAQDSTQQGQSFLIIAPKTCYSPQESSNYKMWGLATQLYSLKGNSSWGMGDFGDLAELVEQSANRGASTIGLNPLHPLFPDNPAHRSPYSPTSRQFLNTLYIDVTKVVNFHQCDEAIAMVNSDEFQTKIDALNQLENIDYTGCAQLKYSVLEKLFEHFYQNHIGKNSQQSKNFKLFQKSFSPELNTLATFDALYEHFRKQDFHAFGWTAWPIEYQSPDSIAVKSFQRSHQKRILYFEFLQWVADTQLASVATQANEKGMPVGLYLDLAVGCDGNGADVWANRSAYVSGGSVGAPPDATNLLGQDWGLTPINPLSLKEHGYQALVKSLRSNMRHAGALRIDHVLGYMRQYWVAPGKKANEGIYISFPFEEMLRIIALESRRAKCVVIGEDLGTTPQGFGEIMATAGLLSYRVLFFERWESGLFKRPENYPEQSMVTVSTHDLPTLAGWWCGNDLNWRQQLKLYPDLATEQNESNARVTDRQQLLSALVDMDLISENDFPETSPAKINQALPEAVQKFLAKAPSQIQLIPLEDALGMTEQVNIPGTIDEHPNWLQRLPLNNNEIWQQPHMKNLLRAMQQERPGGKILVKDTSEKIA